MEFYEIANLSFVFREIRKKPSTLSNRSADTAKTQYDTNRRRDSKCEELGWKKEPKVWRKDTKEVQVVQSPEGNLSTAEAQSVRLGRWPTHKAAHLPEVAKAGEKAFDSE
jgi:hypothetical protein